MFLLCDARKKWEDIKNIEHIIQNIDVSKIYLEFYKGFKTRKIKASNILSFELMNNHTASFFRELLKYNFTRHPLSSFLVMLYGRLFSFNFTKTIEACDFIKTKKDEKLLVFFWRSASIYTTTQGEQILQLIIESPLVSIDFAKKVLNKKTFSKYDNIRKLFYDYISKIKNLRNIKYLFFPYRITIQYHMIFSFYKAYPPAIKIFFDAFSVIKKETIVSNIKYDPDFYKYEEHLIYIGKDFWRSFKFNDKRIKKEFSHKLINTIFRSILIEYLTRKGPEDSILKGFFESEIKIVDKDEEILMRLMKDIELKNCKNFLCILLNKIKDKCFTSSDISCQELNDFKGKTIRLIEVSPTKNFVEFGVNLVYKDLKGAEHEQKFAFFSFFYQYDVITLNVFLYKDNNDIKSKNLTLDKKYIIVELFELLKILGITTGCLKEIKFLDKAVKYYSVFNQSTL